ESFRLYDTLLAKYSTEARTGFELARAMVEAAEIQGLCDDLGVTAHAPGMDGKSERFQARLEELLNPVKPLLGIDEAGRWEQRAKLVMGMVETSGQNFATSIRQAMDAAAMMAALRVMKNIPAALDTGRPFSTEIPVLTQNALCLIESDLPAGLETSEKLVAAAPENPLHLAVYALAAQKSGDDANALQAIEEALQLWPDEANWQAWAGELALHMDDVAMSLKHFQAALTLQPDNAGFATEVGEVLSLSGDYQQAIEVLRNAAEMAPDSPAAWLGLARAQKGLGLIDEAIQSALRAADIQDGAAAGLIFASKVCQDSGQKEKALEYARGAYYKDPRNAHSIVNLSRILNLQNKAVESLELISQSIDELGPARELAYERAWLVYQIQGAEAAGALVDHLIEDSPEDSEALALHANVQAELGQLKVAERSAFRSLRLQPNQPGLALALARMNRKAGQLDQAVHLLGQAAIMDPNNIEIYLELGQAYIDRREHSMALQAFDKATKIAPKDARGYYHSALILKETKDYTAAEDMLQKAARFSPEDLVIHRQLVGVMALNLIHKSQEASKAL
ncbi:MAG TPA: tetratricopeptide repeat protein, partial [Anaerolinea sp.]|nr:tetratricopeptide repeat protein [Anaerolinea sp.]